MSRTTIGSEIIRDETISCLSARRHWLAQRRAFTDASVSEDCSISTIEKRRDRSADYLHPTAWQDSCATLHMWTQIVGFVKAPAA